MRTILDLPLQLVPPEVFQFRAGERGHLIGRRPANHERAIARTRRLADVINAVGQPDFAKPDLAFEFERGGRFLLGYQK